MEYRSIPQVRLPVSRIILGCASDGFNGGRNMSAVLDAALAAGINTLDTARTPRWPRASTRWTRRGCMPSPST